MAYVDNNLLAGESVVYLGRRALYKFFPLLGFCLALLLAYVFILQSLYLVLVASIFFVYFVFDFTSVEFAITSRRVIVKKGVFRLNTIEISLEMIESVEVTQSFFEYTVNVGDVLVTGTGSKQEKIEGVKSPIEFKNAFLNEKDKRKMALSTESKSFEIPQR